jgi:hypothetical protein
MEKDLSITASGSKMRVYQLDRPGSLDGLVLAERNVPSPAADEVLIRVRASSLNFRDLMIINGQYPMPVSSSRVPLSDGAGEVVAVGVSVTRFKVGDRVINSFFPNWFGGTFNAMPQQYVVDCDGWLTEYKAVSAEALVAMPGYLTFEQAATLPCVAVTAWSALSGVRAGKTVLTLPGPKSDVQESQWLMKLHTYGLLPNSFRPPQEIRWLRSYWRQRQNHVGSAASCIHRMDKVLTEMNVRLSSAVTDLSGATGLAIIQAIVDGERDPHELNTAS